MKQGTLHTPTPRLPRSSRLRIAGIVVLVVAVTITTSCRAKAEDSKEKGWVINCAGPDFKKFSQPGSKALGPDRPAFRINDRLVVAVPATFNPAALPNPGEPSPCRSLSDLKPVPFLTFGFQGDWSTKHPPSDLPKYHTRMRDVRADWVSIRIEQSPPPLHPTGEVNAEREPYEDVVKEIAGLSCAGSETVGGNYPFHCIGSENRGTPEVVLRYGGWTASTVVIDASYVSSRYGGVRIYWRVYTSSPANWREIDHQIWHLLSEWDLADESQGPPRTASGQ